MKDPMRAILAADDRRQIGGRGVGWWCRFELELGKPLIWASKDVAVVGAWAMDSGGEIDAWRSMASPIATRPPPNDRSIGEDSNGGAVLTFRSPEDRVLEYECGGGTWWRMGSPFESSKGT